MNAFDRAQQAYDDLHPPEVDDEMLDEDAAIEIAADEVMSAGAAVADVLARVCDIGLPSWAPAKVEHLDCKNLQSEPPHILLGAAMVGDDRLAMAALHQLRVIVRMHMTDDIDGRARELLREQEVQE